MKHSVIILVRLLSPASHPRQWSVPREQWELQAEGLRGLRGFGKGCRGREVFSWEGT